MDGGRECATRLGLAGITPAARRSWSSAICAWLRSPADAITQHTSPPPPRFEVIRRAKVRGLPVSCDTAPHYFALNEYRRGEYRTFAKVSRRCAAKEDRKAVVAGLQDGTIDAIASDHAPQDQESKRLPFASAEPGIVGLETLLAAGARASSQPAVPLLDVLRALTQRPCGDSAPARRHPGIGRGRRIRRLRSRPAVAHRDRQVPLEMPETRLMTAGRYRAARSAPCWAVAASCAPGLSDRAMSPELPNLALLALGAYLMGSIPFGLVLTRLAGHGGRARDRLRQHRRH